MASKPSKTKKIYTSKKTPSLLGKALIDIIDMRKSINKQRKGEKCSDSMRAISLEICNDHNYVRRLVAGSFETPSPVLLNKLSIFLGKPPTFLFDLWAEDTRRKFGGNITQIKYDAQLQFINENWDDLPKSTQDFLNNMAQEATKYEKKKKRKK